MHEAVVYPENDTTRSRYPLANILTGATMCRRDDVTLMTPNVVLNDDPDPTIRSDHVTGIEVTPWKTGQKTPEKSVTESNRQYNNLNLGLLHNSVTQPRYASETLSIPPSSAKYPKRPANTRISFFVASPSRTSPSQIACTR